MQPALRYCAGWACAAVVATSLSWVAIRDVVATAAVGDPVPAQSVVEARGGPRPTGDGGAPEPTVTTVPSVSLSPRERRPPEPTGATATESRETATRAPERRDRDADRGSGWPSPTSSGRYQGYVMRGGQVVVQLRQSDASLVTAVPASGYETRTWKTGTWFRVDFVSGDRRSSLIVSWYGHPPMANVTEH